MQNQTEPIDLMGAGTQVVPSSEPVSDPDFGVWLPPALMIFGVSLATWIMVRMLIRRRRRISITDGTPHERLETIREQAKKRAQLSGFAADVHELVQRLAAQLDNKAARMEQLLQDADERIRKLERMQRIEHPRASAESERVPGLMSGSATGPTSGLGSGLGSDSALGHEGDPVTNRVYELADQGEKPVEIARQVNQHVGQVELILALRRG